MEHTLVAVFASEAHAQDALNDLLSCGIARDDMQIHASQRDEISERASAPAQTQDESFGEKIKSFFRNMFGSGNEDQGSLYAEAARRGHYVLTVVARDERQMTRASDVLNQHSPIDIEERAAEWRSSGWSPEADYAARSSGFAAGSEGIDAAGGIEVADALRRSEIERTQQARAEAESQALPAADDQLLAGKRVMQRGGVRVVQHAVSAQDEQEPVDSEFRTHWQQSFSQAGGRYEDYAPAYRYGYTMHGSNQYRGRTWEEIEPQIRADWEAKNAGSPWERAKDAVRVGWEKLID